MNTRFISAVAAFAGSALVLSGCGEASLAGGSASEGADWPSKNIKIIAPYGPGGDTDFNARAYANRLEEELETTVTVANVEGNGGSTGAQEAANAAPDGYTALFMHAALIVNEVAGIADVGLDDFEYVATAASSPGDIVTVSSDSGFETLEDLIKYSQENPGELKVAADVGATTHVMALQLQKAGADLNIVSAGGASDRVAALKGGHIDVIINPYGTVADYLENGDFTALANMKPERAEGFPDIPTAQEQGYDVQWTNYYFVAMPKGTPEAIIDEFADALETVNGQEDYQEEIFEAYKQEPVFKPADEGLADMAEIRELVEQFEDEFKK